MDEAQLASSSRPPSPAAQMWHHVEVTARSQHRDLWATFQQSALSQQHVIPQVCKVRITLNCSPGRTKEGNTSKISFPITSSVTEGFYPAVVESFVFLRELGGANSQGGKTNTWFSPTLVRSLCSIQQPQICPSSFVHSQLQLLP